MAIPHAHSGEVVDVRPLGPALSAARTNTLVKSKTLEVIRLVVPAGKEIPTHDVPGEVLLQCLEGMAGIQIDGDTQVLEAGQLLYLSGGAPHAVRGIEDTSLLVTILLHGS